MVKEPTGPLRFKLERGMVPSEAGRCHLPVAVTTIEFLPVQAREEIVLIFRSEPSGASVDVVSYQQP